MMQQVLVIVDRLLRRSGLLNQAIEALVMQVVPHKTAAGCVVNCVRYQHCRMPGCVAILHYSDRQCTQISCIFSCAC